MQDLVQGAALAPLTTGVLTPGNFRRLLIALVAIALALTMIAIETPGATHARASDAARIVMYARSHIGARFRIGTEGPRYFDCSGLVYRVYRQAGVLRRIGGTRMRAANYYSWFRRRGLLSRRNPRAGDIIWWTKKGHIAHMGLYIGSGQAISALINPWGVKRHSVGGIRVRFLAFGHTRLSR